jgi:DNA mismatch repair ATPase MutS
VTRYDGRSFCWSVEYNAVKQQVPNALQMFRLGDFCELFTEDAIRRMATFASHPSTHS